MIWGYGPSNINNISMNTSLSGNRKLYNNLVRKKIILIVCLVVGTFISLIINIAIGSSSIPIMEVLSVLFGGEGIGHNGMIIKNIRLPMSLMAIVVGGALGVGGCEIQTILRNPIASPYTLGISAAASFGAALGLILESNIFYVPKTLIVTVNSFVFSMLAAAVIYLFSRQKYIGKNAIILFGVAINFLFNSLTMTLQYIADEDELQSLVFWSFGSLLKTNWSKFIIVLIALVLCFAILYKNAWKLTAMSLDDTKARSIGVNTSKIRRMVILVVSLLSAFAVCFVGTIGFIGLIAPHIARLLVGEDQRYFMPISLLLGAFVLSLSFMLSKLIIPGVILPIGLVTSVIGIPFFMTIIFNKKRVI
ncbi:iron complex transport system permease protein [Maledivibacter halophilus]|uniref:Iron complex transport system permease protein n=2 Tax=Maledivibacter halophilus TaxID=36842 RepID=A0A1T5IJM4_9FIRM|nr:iron complex transport system permease protein [Maledivibacter halophilus]